MEWWGGEGGRKVGGGKGRWVGKGGRKVDGGGGMKNRRMRNLEFRRVI